MFDLRPKYGPTIRGASVSSVPIEITITDGDSVELRIQDQKILVSGIVHLKSGSYRGSVRNFLQSSVLQSKGIKYGQEVEFSYLQIFACN
jgi:hypothetical protein